MYSGVDVTCTFCKPGAARDAARSHIGTCASAIALAAVSGAPRLDPTVTSTSFPETLRPPICSVLYVESGVLPISITSEFNPSGVDTSISGPAATCGVLIRNASCSPAYAVYSSRIL